MRQKFVKITLLFFSVLVIAVLLIVKPLYERLLFEVSDRTQNAFENISREIGMDISYESISPSILSAFNIKGIVIKDTKADSESIKIERASISYSLKKIFEKRFDESLTSVSISGVDIFYSEPETKEAIFRIIDYFSSDETDKKKDEKEKKDVREVLKTVTKYLPSRVNAKDIRAHFSSENLSATASLQSLLLKKDSADNSVFASLNGSARAETCVLKKTVSAGISLSLSGNLTSIINESSARVHVSPLSNCDYSIGKTDFLFQYSEDSFLLRTLQGVLPISALAQYNWKEKSVHAVAKTDNFSPLSLFIINKKNFLASYLPYIREFRISGDYEADFDIDKREFFYKAAGSAKGRVPKLEQNANLSYSLSGDLRRIIAKKAQIRSKMIDAEFEGSFDLKNLFPSGSLFVEKFVVPTSKNVISAEIYAEPNDLGLLILSPEVFFGEEQGVSALQLQLIPKKASIDFSFEANDFSHLEYEEAALLALNGSILLGKKPFLQANVDVSNLFIDSALEKAAFFLKEETSQKLQNAASHLSPYITSVSLFVSSDFKSFSFNIPYAIAANTKQDRQMFVFSADGNEDTFNITDLDLVFGMMSVQMDTQANLSGSILHDIGDISFQSQLAVNSVQYDLTGSIIDKKWVSIAGDYNLEISFSLELPFLGIVRMDSLPFAIGKNTFALSLDAAVAYTAEEGPVVDFQRLELNSVSSFFIAESPSLLLSGRLDRLGVIFDSLFYSDSISALEGSLSFTWNREDGILNSADLQAYLMNPLSAEQISLYALVSNPDALPLSSQAIKSGFFYSAEAKIDSFPMSHFFSHQQASDTLSATLSASGTIEDTFLSLSLQNLSITLLQKPLCASGNAVLEGSNLNVSPLDITWGTTKINETSGTFDLKTLSGSLLTNIETKFLKQEAKIPLAVEVESMSTTGAKKPDVVMFSVNTDNITTTFLNESLSFSMSLIRSAGRFDLLVDGSAGITAYRLDSGEFMLQMTEDSPVRANADGFLRADSIDVSVHDVYIDLSHLQWVINSPAFAVYNGIVKGNARASGILSDPELSGAFTINSMEMTSPAFLSERMGCDFITATLEHNEISMPESLFIAQKKAGAVFATIKVIFDRLRFDRIEVKIRTPEKNFLPIDAKIDPLNVKGKVAGNLFLNITLESVDVSGSLSASDTTLEIDNPLNQTLTQTLNFDFSGKSKDVAAQQTDTGAPDMDISVNLDFIAGQKVQILFPPILRALIAPNTALSMSFDSATETLGIEGDVTLRGGEVMYLNRNFYLREGRVSFDRNNSFDPRLTVSAEIRERDSKNENVTIMLTAVDQNVSTFSPRLSASPAKSEAEVMALLGQAISADSDSAGQIAGSLLDYGVQTLAFRKVENTLRDLLNFDIFSIRVTALQNALAQNSSQKNKESEYTLGNFFDNSTVYIGKYFGSFIYVDSLMRWNYDKNKVADGTSTTGLIFQPEIGFEMQSPFATIRMDLAPDVSSNQSLLSSNLWVQATSFTLSWKINF